MRVLGRAHDPKTWKDTDLSFPLRESSGLSAVKSNYLSRLSAYRYLN